MKNVLFIYNPNSGKRVISSQRDKLVGIFTEEGMIPTIARIGAINDNDSVRELIASGRFDGVIVAGGDGSVNTIIKTVLDTGADIPVGIIPTGTCNDFSRSLGMPSDIIRCARLIAQGNVISIDIGLINDGESIFVNEIGGGVLATVSFSTDQNLKKLFAFTVLIEHYCTTHHFAPVFTAPTTVCSVFAYSVLINEFFPKILVAKMILGKKDHRVVSNTKGVAFVDAKVHSVIYLVGYYIIHNYSPNTLKAGIKINIGT